MKSLSKLISTAAVILSASLPFHTAISQVPSTIINAEHHTIESRIRQEFLTTLNPQIGAKPNIQEHDVYVEKLEPDWKIYDAVSAGFSETFKDVSQRHKSISQSFWYGFVGLGNKRMIGLFDFHQPGASFSTHIFEPINPSEERCVRKLLDFSTLSPTPIKPHPYTLSELSKDPWNIFNQCVTHAKKDTSYRAHVTDELVMKAREALMSAGGNYLEFLKAMSVMDSTQSVLALQLLSFMNNDQYGSQEKNGNIIKDLHHQKAEAFYEHVAVVSHSLKAYPWAREQANRDWALFTQGVLPARFTQEQDVGSRMHLFTATRELLQNTSTTSTLEEAVERIISFSPKLFRYSQGYGFEDANWLQYSVSHLDRCEAMAMFGGVLLRAAGIPSFYAFTPWWADADNNHAWNWVQYVKPDRTLGFYSFLAGNRNYLGNGKLDLHVNDKLNPAFGASGMPGCAKVYLTIQGPGRKHLLDITPQCTITTSIYEDLGKHHASQPVHLSVFNSGTFRPVQTVLCDTNGNVRFDHVGCIPRIANADFEQLNGLMYGILDQQGFVKPPFIITSRGSKLWISAVESNLPPRRWISGFDPLTTYALHVFAKNPSPNNQMGFVKIADFSSNEQGNMHIPVQPYNLVLPIDQKTGKGRPYIIVGDPSKGLVAVRR